MKLRNKKTGDIGELSVWYRADNKEIKEFGVIKENEKFPTDYKSLAELNEDWEDYEEPKGSALDLMILTLTNFIENEPDDTLIDLEDCKQMLEKLKAYKRLKDKGFHFNGWDNTIGDDYYKPGQIVISLNGNPDWDEYESIDDIKDELNLLFGNNE